MSLSKRYIKIGLAIYFVLAITYIFSGGDLTENLQYRADKMSHPTNELTLGKHIFRKYSHDAIINNVTYYIFYSNTALYGKSRECYFLASKEAEEDMPLSKYVVTDNLAKYTLVTSKSVGYAIWNPFVSEAIIDGGSYNYDLAGPVSSYDLAWAKRSRRDYVMTKSLFILSIPYDLVTHPLLPIKICIRGG